MHKRGKDGWARRVQLLELRRQDPYFCEVTLREGHKTLILGKKRRRKGDRPRRLPLTTLELL